MVTPVHKNTIALLILIVCNVTFGMLAKYIIGNFSGFFEGAPTFLTPKLPFAALRTIWGSKKVLAPSENPSKLCVLPA
jgi:hypothetical protein